jgi:hypothetical protein
MGSMATFSNLNEDEFEATLFYLQSVPEFVQQSDGETSFRQMSPAGRFTSRRALEVIHNPANELDKEAFVAKICERFNFSRNRGVGWYYRYRHLIRRYTPSKF